MWQTLATNPLVVTLTYSSAQDLKLRKEGEQEKGSEYILTDVLQVWFQARPFAGGS
jgi:hypothetical protein